jgi:hydrogenase maturation protein HypF
MLPYTPLHHILVKLVGLPLVATSGNLSDEPICTDEREAIVRLRSLADLFLVHDRPIERHVDDSVARIALHRELVHRRARGYAPLPVDVGVQLPPILAVGAHLKNTVALSHGTDVCISQHIGDLETAQASAAFVRVGEDLARLHGLVPTAVACDAHPDYLSTRYAVHTGLPVIRVQHHHAHVLSCMAENGVRPPALGIAWDGTGYGLDQTVWGGEFFRVTDSGCARVTHLRTFRLPGGESAVVEPRRSAVGLLFEMLGDAWVEREDLAPVRAFLPRERSVLAAVLRNRINAPFTSSAGRLFDAVAALLGIRSITTFEGQAAMELEWAIGQSRTDITYSFHVIPKDAMLILDWSPTIEAILSDIADGKSTASMAAAFHNTLADMIVEIARRMDEPAVALSGGCFQNRYLTERTVHRLRSAGFSPYWHQRVPPNDGGIALGQIVAAAHGKE